jgi:hypothetical protein
VLHPILRFFFGMNETYTCMQEFSSTIISRCIGKLIHKNELTYSLEGGDTQCCLYNTTSMYKRVFSKNLASGL